MAKAFQTVASGDPNPPAKTSTASNSPVFAGETISVVAADLTLNATFGHIVVPAGAEIVGAALYSSDNDTGTALVLSVGDAVAGDPDDDRLIAGATVGQAGGLTTTLAASGFGYRYEDETLIQIKVKTAPTSAPTSGTLKYGVWYISQ